MPTGRIMALRAIRANRESKVSGFSGCVALRHITDHTQSFDRVDVALNDQFLREIAAHSAAAL